MRLITNHMSSDTTAGHACEERDERVDVETERLRERLRDVVEPVRPVEQPDVVVAEVVEDERQRDQDDREVIGSQPPERDQRDDEREAHRRDPAEQQVDRERKAEPEDVELPAAVRAVQAEDAGEVGADRDEADVREVEDPRLAVLDVQPHREDEVVEQEEDEGEDVVRHYVVPGRAISPLGRMSRVRIRITNAMSSL